MERSLAGDAAAFVTVWYPSGGLFKPDILPQHDLLLK
jgi:hypothetical protein